MNLNQYYCLYLQFSLAVPIIQDYRHLPFWVFHLDLKSIQFLIVWLVHQLLLDYTSGCLLWPQIRKLWFCYVLEWFHLLTLHFRIQSWWLKRLNSFLDHRLRICIDQKSLNPKFWGHSSIAVGTLKTSIRKFHFGLRNIVSIIICSNLIPYFEYYYFYLLFLPCLTHCFVLRNFYLFHFFYFYFLPSSFKKTYLAIAK